MVALTPAAAARCHAILECPHASKELRETAQRLLRPAAAAASAAPLANQPKLQLPVAAPRLSTWTCAACTLVHDQTAVTACAVCGATKPLVPGAAWTCTSCTFSNRAQRSKCEVCAEPRAGAVPRPTEEQRRVEKRRRQVATAAAMTDGDDDFI